MDHYTTKQVQIILRRTERAAKYLALWSRIISDWSNPSEEDSTWLIAPAN